MRLTFRFLLSVLTIITSVPALRAQAVDAPPLAGAPAGTSFFPVAPCRVLDTSAESAERKLDRSPRRVDVQSTRCARIIPSEALGYALEVVTYGARDPGTGKVDRAANRTTSRVPENRVLVFPMVAQGDLAVDVYGYYTAPGRPQPVPSSAPNTTAPLAASSMSRGRPTISSGTLGEVVLDGSAGADSGVFLRSTAQSAAPWITAQGGTGGGFRVITAAGAAVLNVRSDGAVWLPSTSFFDGRQDYYGTSTSYYGNVAIPTNIVYDATLNNPRDAAGASTQAVAFFNAQSDDENGSPSVTKYRAFTRNLSDHVNINFDSQIQYQGSNAYHFRAYSGYDQFDTFWVKAIQDGGHNRADKYVSGNIGIRTPALAPWVGFRAIEGPNTAVAFGNTTDLHFLSNAYYDGSAWRYKEAGVAADYYVYSGSHVWQVAGSGAVNGTLTWSPAMVLNGGGTLGIGTSAPSASYKLDVNGSEHVAANLAVDGNVTVTGNITAARVLNAVYQDVAEWVPASGDLRPGTVVVLDAHASNHVVPSVVAYDTKVAGVVSPSPGIILGEAGEAKATIATTGRVRVRVDAADAPIAIGDLLVTSGIAGTAMKSQPVIVNGRTFHQPGTIVGKALEPLEKGKGEILVLLSLQ